MNNILAIDTVIGCNYSCHFCIPEFRDSKPKYYTMENFKKILIEAQKCEVNYLILTPLGGEIALDPTFIEKIEYALQNFHVTFFTNFSLFTPEVQDNLFKVCRSAKYNLCIRISDYGDDDIELFKKQTGMSETVWNKYHNNLKYLTDFQPIMKEKYVVRHARDKKFDFFAYNEEILYDKINGICFMASCPVILMNGDMVSCQCGNPYTEEILHLGNIYEKSFSECFFSPKRYELFEMFKNKEFPHQCLHCPNYAPSDEPQCIAQHLIPKYGVVNNFKTLMHIKKINNL